MHGVYNDGGDGEDLNEDYHATEGTSTARISDNLSQVHADQSRNVRHEAVEVPQQSSPFTAGNDEEFFSVLKVIVDDDIVPEGYGLLEGEIDGEDAKMVEILPFGNHGTKSFTVSLTDPVWTAWIKLWAQAVELLSVFEADGQVL